MRKDNFQIYNSILKGFMTNNKDRLERIIKDERIVNERQSKRKIQDKK